jgi:hypothetical protein
VFALAVLSLAPNATGVPWGTHVDNPALMSSAVLERLVPAASTVLALPYGIDGNSMAWQVEAGFRFGMAGGYISWAVPAGYRNLSLLHELVGRSPRPRATARLCSFLERTGATRVIARDHTSRTWRALLDPLGARPVHSGGFLVYDVPGRCRGPGLGFDFGRMAQGTVRPTL